MIQNTTYCDNTISASCTTPSTIKWIKNPNKTKTGTLKSLITKLTEVIFMLWNKITYTLWIGCISCSMLKMPYLLFKWWCRDAGSFGHDSVHPSHNVAEPLLWNGTVVRYRLDHLPTILPLHRADHSCIHMQNIYLLASVLLTIYCGYISPR